MTLRLPDDSDPSRMFGLIFFSALYLAIGFGVGWWAHPAIPEGSIVVLDAAWCEVLPTHYECSMGDVKVYEMEGKR